MTGCGEDRFDEPPVFSAEEPAHVRVDAWRTWPRTTKGAKVRYSGSKRTAIDGPFTEGEVEVRQVFELDDFGQSDAVEQHRQIFDKITKQK